MTEPVSYQDNVFVNCPFDSTYKPLFRATLFTRPVSGFVTVLPAICKDNRLDLDKLTYLDHLTCVIGWLAESRE